MPKFIDLTGQKFGRLTVLRQGNKRGKRICWVCICECGVELEIKSNSLRTGNTISCGCYRKEFIKEKFSKPGGPQESVPGYNSWKSMKQRCFDKNNDSYKNYGAKGITICDRWLHSFDNFIADMGPKPGLGYSIDRKDVNGNYEPGNCRWATATEQSRNQGTAKNNSSGAKGVRWHKQKQKWEVVIGVNNKLIHIGLFETFEEAVKAREQAEIKYWGKSSD